MMKFEIDRPNDKQRLAMLDKHRHVGYGGARGGGKSWFVQNKASMLALKYPGIRTLIVRQSFPELQQNHILPLTAKLVPMVARYVKADKTFYFLNDSIIKLDYCQNDGDLNHIQGVEYDVIFIDEATNLSEYQLKAIAACCRGVNNFPKRIYYTCNPGGQGHAYIKRVFIDKQYREGETPEDYSFVQAKVTDNKALMQADPEYIKFLQALPPKLRKAWLDGDWNTLSGAVFEELVDDSEHYIDRQWTHIIEPFQIPPGWKIYRSYDFGYSKPFSFGWWAVDYDGRIYRILEWYGGNGEPNEGLKLTAQDQFKQVAEIERQHPYLKGKQIIGVADPAIWQAESGESVADVAQHYGIYFEKGDNARIAGWLQMHYRLEFDENGIPMMYVFNTCKDWIRTIPLMMYDEHKVEDVDSDLEDHAADETRYMCMSRPIKPKHENPNIPVGFDPLNQRTPKHANRFITH